MSIQQPSQEPDPLSASHWRYIEAVKAGDVETLVSMFCEEAVYMPLNEPSLYGAGEVREWFEDYYEHFQIEVLTDTERDVTFFDGWALERWAYMIAIAPISGGERIRDDGRFMVVWRREPDNTWKIFQQMHNSIRPIGSGTSRFLARMTERRKKRES
jgi:ketosteroid isomerase-like protein